MVFFINISLNGCRFLNVKPYQQAVEPVPFHLEPPAAAQLFSSEPQDEVAVAELPEGQAGVHEFEMLESELTGVNHGLPYRQHTGILRGIALSHSAGENQVGRISGVQADCTSDDFMFVADQENIAVMLLFRVCLQVKEKIKVGQVPVNLV